MELITFVEKQIDEIKAIFLKYPIFSDVVVTSGMYQNKYIHPTNDAIIVNILIPSIQSNTSTCNRRIFGTVIAQLKLNFCIKRNPNYDIYYDVLEVLRLDTKYTDMISSEISIEAGRGLVTINASKILLIKV